MIKKSLCFCFFLSTFLLANEQNEIKKPILANKAIESQKKAIDIQANNKIEIVKEKSLIGSININDKVITIENQEIKDKFMDFIKKDLMIKNPNIRLEIEEPKKVSIDDSDLDGCKSCHGYEFNKAALGASKILSKMTNEEILNALNGYKDGTYGSSMKSMMKSQLMKYTNEEITEIANSISKYSENK